MKAATAVRCAKELVAEVTRNFPALKEHITREEYDQAYGLLLKPRADYHYDVGAINTLISIYKVKSELPALIVNGETINGFHTVEELEKTVPALRELAHLKALESATTTAPKKVN